LIKIIIMIQENEKYHACVVCGVCITILPKSDLTPIPISSLSLSYSFLVKFILLMIEIFFFFDKSVEFIKKRKRGATLSTQGGIQRG
jgi:hypothetical protein